MIYPTRLLLALVAVPALLSFGLIVDASWWPALIGLDTAILCAALIDALAGQARAGAFQVALQLPQTWSLGRDETVTVRLDHLARLPRSVRVVVDLPALLRSNENDHVLRLPGRARAEFTCAVTPLARGSATLAGIHLAVTSRLGLWVRHLRVGATHAIRVYPDLKQIADFAALARTNRLSLIGVRSTRRIGGDTEFERLRDWMPGDALARIDWKASARRDHLTVRAYQVSQSQTLMLMLDAGRLMVARAPGRNGREASLLDHGLNAALMLAHVAITHGDQVGLLVYDEQVRRFLPPDGGARQLHRIVHALHDVEPVLTESRHDLAFAHLGRLVRKRSLVTCLTQVLDDRNADALERLLGNLVGRHLPLGVLLRDPDLDEPLAHAPQSARAFWDAGAAAVISTWRQDAIGRLVRAGVLVLDVAPQELTTELINRYLTVKARHLL